MAKKKKYFLKINGDTMTTVVVFSLLFCVVVIVWGMLQAKDGVDSTEFAGFIKSPLYRVEVDENGEEVEMDEVVGERYALRYGEFVALNTHMIQKLMAKVEELENRIAKLEG